MSKNKKTSVGFGAKIKESIRKFIVSLKRNPSVIPLVMLLVSFLYYSLNLTEMSKTTARIQSSGMGLCQFIIMLLGLLSMVCMLNSFPRRKKPNYPMIALLAIMLIAIFVCDTLYINSIFAAVYKPGEEIALNDETLFIFNAYNMLGVHRILVAVSGALVALLPVYSKLLKKINTSVEVEDNGTMGEIEISE